MGYIQGCLSRLGFSSGSRFQGEPPRRQRTLALHGPDYRQGPLPLPLPLLVGGGSLAEAEEEDTQVGCVFLRKKNDGEVTFV